MAACQHLLIFLAAFWLDFFQEISKTNFLIQFYGKETNENSVS